MLVYVQNIAGAPLMPTRRLGKVRRMLNSGQAVIVNYEQQRQMNYMLPRQT